MEPYYSGKATNVFSRRLADSFDELANWFEIKPAKKKAFCTQEEGKYQALWNYLEVRDKLKELPKALCDIDREDLFEALEQYRIPSSSAHNDDEQESAHNDEQEETESDASFKDKTWFKNETQAKKRYRHLLSKQLRRSNRLRQKLSQKILGKDDPGVEALVNHIFKKSGSKAFFKEIMGKLEQLHEETKDSENNNLNKFNKSSNQAEIVLEIARTLAPFLYDFAVVVETNDQYHASKEKPVSPPFHLETTAEIIMAGLDCAPAEFKPKKRERDYPPGLYKLSLTSPETGIDGEEETSLVQEHLERKEAKVLKFFKSLGSAGSLRENLDNSLSDYFIKLEPGTSKPAERNKRIKMIRGAISRETETNRRRFYFIFREQNTPSETIIMNRFIAELREDYPEIICLQLTQDPVSGEPERNQLRQFCNMLPKED
ncbi:hypothetical protein ACQZV8_16040 [Magnetococcales bacterium HHB-1]